MGVLPDGFIVVGGMVAETQAARNPPFD